MLEGSGGGADAGSCTPRCQASGRCFPLCLLILRVCRQRPSSECRVQNKNNNKGIGSCAAAVVLVVSGNAVWDNFWTTWGRKYNGINEGAAPREVSVLANAHGSDETAASECCEHADIDAFVRAFAALCLPEDTHRSTSVSGFVWRRKATLLCILRSVNSEVIG